MNEYTTAQSTGPGGRPNGHSGETERSKENLRLWLRLLAKTNQIEKNLQGRLRAKFDTTLPRFDVLAELYRRPGGVTMGELSSMLMVSNGNITGLARRLEDDGMIMRVPVPSDRRTNILFITRDGQSAFEEMAQEHELWIKDLFGGLNDSDIGLLQALLEQINPEEAQA